MKDRGLSQSTHRIVEARRIRLDDGTLAHRYILSGQVSGPGNAGRSIEQIARPIQARHPAYGEVRLTPAMFESFIKNFTDNVYGQKVQVDRNHKPGDGVQGDVDRLFIGTDTALLMEMVWSDLGRRTYSDDGFRYFSIDFTEDYVHPETGAHHGPLLFGVALCPRPFIKHMPPSQGPGRMVLHEGRSFFVPDYLNLPQGDPMKKFLKILKAALEAKKLSATVVGVLLAQAQHEAEAKKLSDDADGEFDAIRAHYESVAAKLAEDENNLEKAPAKTGTESKTLSEDDVAKIVARTLAESADKAKKLATDETANRKTFTDAIDAAKGLSDGTKETLKKQAEAITGTMTSEQIKRLSDAAIELGNQAEVQAQKLRLGLTGVDGRIGSVEVVEGGVGSQVHALMRGKLQLSDHASSLALPEEKQLSGFARKTLAIFDRIHATRLEAERKMLAEDGSTNIADGQFPVAVQRQVIVELLADLAVMALVQTLTDPGAQFTTQIPYEERNVANIRNGAITYEGQGIARAGVTQKMDNAYLTPRKLALMLSNEMIHFSRASQINWDAWARNIASNARLMKDIIAVAIMNELQRSADAFGAATVTSEAITAQVTGTETVFKTAQFPVVRPKQVKDLQGNNVGNAENPITLTYDGDVLPMWDGTGKQADGLYYHFVDWNQGLFSIVDEDGVVQAPAAATTTLSYSYATNVVKWDIDIPGGTDADVHYNALLDLFGDAKAYLMQNRYVDVQFALMATTLHNTITKAKRFEANSQKAGTGLNSDGDLERVKSVPCFSTNQPGADMAEGRIILGQRNTLTYTIAKPFVTGTPFEAVNSEGEPTGEKIAYGEEYSAIHVPSPIRNRLRSIVVYSATARAAI